MRRFTLPDSGALAYSRAPLRAQVDVINLSAQCSIICRSTASTDQPRMFDHEWMLFIFNTGSQALRHTALDFAALPLGPGAVGNRTGQDFMLYLLLQDADGGPSGAWFGAGLHIS